VSLVNAVISRLKHGSIKDVVLFSDGMKIPPPPFVMVKPETGVIENTRRIRIIVHHTAGMFDALEKYVANEIEHLLPGWIDDDEGRRYSLYKAGMTDITAEPGGDTYFMERIYVSPLPGMH